jgi:hypothetical protein
MNSTEAIVKIVQQCTDASIAMNPRREMIQDTDQRLSEKGTVVKNKIERANVDDDTKEILADLMSVIFNETIQVDTDNEEDDRVGRKLEVGLFTLLVCIKEMDDRRDNSIDEDEFVLCVAQDTDDLYGNSSFNNIENDLFCIAEEATYCLGTNDTLCENQFRFATHEEIERFIKKLPETTLKFWFGHAILAAKSFGVQII